MLQDLKNFFSSFVYFSQLLLQMIAWRYLVHQVDWEFALNFLGGRKEYPTVCPDLIQINS